MNTSDRMNAMREALARAAELLRAAGELGGEARVHVQRLARGVELRDDRRLGGARDDVAVDGHDALPREALDRRGAHRSAISTTSASRTLRRAPRSGRSSARWPPW
jgi:hypothetical protein